MRADSQTRADKYLTRRRRADEAKALRRVAATVEDLRLWRRDPGFRECERVARLACDTGARPRIVNLADYGSDEEKRAQGWEHIERSGLGPRPTWTEFRPEGGACP